jgi:hypothetical protein
LELSFEFSEKKELGSDNWMVMESSALFQLILVICTIVQRYLSVLAWLRQSRRAVRLGQAAKVPGTPEFTFCPTGRALRPTGMLPRIAVEFGSVSPTVARKPIAHALP